LFNPVAQLTVWGIIILALVPAYTRHLRIAGGTLSIGVGITTTPVADATAELQQRAADRASGTIRGGACTCFRPQASNDPELNRLPPRYSVGPLVPVDVDAAGAAGTADGLVCGRTLFSSSICRCCCSNWRVMVQTRHIVGARVATIEDLVGSRSCGTSRCFGCRSPSRGAAGNLTDGRVDSSSRPIAMVAIVGRAMYCCFGAQFPSSYCCIDIDPDAGEHVAIETAQVVLVEANDVMYHLNLRELAAELPQSRYGKMWRTQQEETPNSSPGCCVCLQKSSRGVSVVLVTPHDDAGGAAAVANRINQAVQAETERYYGDKAPATAPRMGRGVSSSNAADRLSRGAVTGGVRGDHMPFM